MMTGLTHRAGTLYYLQDGSGGLDGPFRLEVDIEVNLFSSGSWRVYERTDGNPSWLYERPKDNAPLPPDAC